MARRCTTVDLGGGMMATFCGTRARLKSCTVPNCGREHTSLCDFVMQPALPGSGENPKTCDAELCAAHAGRLSPTEHLCPPHAKMGGRRPMTCAKCRIVALSGMVVAGGARPLPAGWVQETVKPLGQSQHVVCENCRRADDAEDETNQ